MQMSWDGVEGRGGRSDGAGPEPAPRGGLGRSGRRMAGVYPGIRAHHTSARALVLGLGRGLRIPDQKFSLSDRGGGVGRAPPPSLFPLRLLTLGVTFSASPIPPLSPCPLLPIAGITLCKQESCL